MKDQSENFTIEDEVNVLFREELQYCKTKEEVNKLFRKYCSLYKLHRNQTWRTRVTAHLMTLCAEKNATFHEEKKTTITQLNLWEDIVSE